MELFYQKVFAGNLCRFLFDYNFRSKDPTELENTIHEDLKPLEKKTKVLKEYLEDEMGKRYRYQNALSNY